jgi:hypothetical protein
LLEDGTRNAVLSMIDFYSGSANDEVTAGRVNIYLHFLFFLPSTPLALFFFPVYNLATWQPDLTEQFHSFTVTVPIFLL